MTFNHTYQKVATVLGIATAVTFAGACGGGGSGGGSGDPPAAEASDLEIAVDARLSYDNVFLTKWGDGSTYKAESDVLLDEDDVNSTMYADLFAEILGNYGTDDGGVPLGITKNDWLTLFDYWINGVLGASPDDEISETVVDDYGVGFDFLNNAIRFYLNTTTGEKAVTAYLDADSMSEVESILEGLLTDIYGRNEDLGLSGYYENGEQIAQSVFDPTS